MSKVTEGHEIESEAGEWIVGSRLHRCLHSGLASLSISVTMVFSPHEYSLEMAHVMFWK